MAYAIRAQRYHEQAAKHRGLADQEENPEVRKALLTVAESYEKLALEVLRQGKVTWPPTRSG